MDVPSATLLAGSRIQGQAALLRVADSPWEQYLLISSTEDAPSVSTELYLLHEYREGLRQLRYSLHKRIETSESEPSLRDVLARAFSVELHELMTVEDVRVAELKSALSDLANTQYALVGAAEQLDRYVARRDLLTTFAGLNLDSFLSGRLDSEIAEGIPLVSRDLNESIKARFQTPTNLLLEEVRHRIQRATEYSGTAASLLSGRIDLIVQSRLEWVQYFALASAITSAVLTILVAHFQFGL
jgi:hypothetical protein